MKYRYGLLGSIAFLFILVVLEEFVPGWDDNLLTAVMAIIQTIAISVLAFILGRTWHD